ncbi:MAG: laminin B domain-containing protein, partial [Opitutales bacterium]
CHPAGPALVFPPDLPMKTLRFLLPVLVLTTFLARSQAQVILSDFNVGLDGWHAYAGADASTTVVYTATGGNGGTGGAILVEPANGANDYFQAPAKFNGDLSAFYNGTLSLDLKLSLAATGGESAMVVLTGSYNGSPLSIGYLPPSGQWPTTGSFTTFALTLNSSQGWTITNSSDYTTSTLATDVQIQSVLSNVTDLRIMGDWTYSQDNDILDNVQLSAVTAVPEPSTLALLLLAGAVTCFGAAWRQYRKNKATVTYSLVRV